jgi:hypothetical protein
MTRQWGVYIVVDMNASSVPLEEKKRVQLRKLTCLSIMLLIDRVKVSCSLWTIFFLFSLLSYSKCHWHNMSLNLIRSISIFFQSKLYKVPLSSWYYGCTGTDPSFRRRGSSITTKTASATAFILPNNGLEVSLGSSACYNWDRSAHLPKPGIILVAYVLCPCTSTKW